MRPLTKYVVHRAPLTPGLPHAADELGVIDARDRRHAREIADAQWPRETHVIQPLGVVLTAEIARRKPPVDWALVARVQRMRGRGR